jgi:hypothetical protein
MRPFPFALSLFLLASPAAACDGGVLHGLMETPLNEGDAESFDVAEQASVEGGAWYIFRDAQGAVKNVMRVDYGETGRLATRLTVSSADAYAVTVTRFGYSAPLGVSGSSTIREEKDIYLFCDGKLYLPEEDFGMTEGYAAKAAEALATFDAAEVQDVLPPLKR